MLRRPRLERKRRERRSITSNQQNLGELQPSRIIVGTFLDLRPFCQAAVKADYDGEQPSGGAVGARADVYRRQGCEESRWLVDCCVLEPLKSRTAQTCTQGL